MSRPTTPTLESRPTDLDETLETLDEKTEIVLQNLGALLHLAKEKGLLACEKAINALIYEKGTPESLGLAIDENNKIDVSDQKGRNELLIRSITLGHQLLAQTLLLSGAASPNRDAEASSSIGTADTPLTAAIRKRLPEVVDVLLAIETTDLNELNDHDETPLMCAASLGEAEIAQRLIRLEVNVNAKNSSGATALIFAADNDMFGDREKTISALLAAGADPKILTNSGHSAFDYSVQSQSFEIAEKLVTSESDRKKLQTLLVQGETKASCLHHAAANGQNDYIEELVRQKSSLDFQDNNGRTPLHYAAARGHLETVKLLLEAGANADLLDKDGKSAASYAAANSHSKISDYLIAKTTGLAGASSMSSLDNSAHKQDRKHVTFARSAAQLSPSASKYLAPKQ